MRPLEKRVIALQELLSLERPTTKAVAYIEWETPPKVVIECEDNLFDNWKESDVIIF
jgi:hypothetical protein